MKERGRPKRKKEQTQPITEYHINNEQDSHINNDNDVQDPHVPIPTNEQNTPTP